MLSCFWKSRKFINDLNAEIELGWTGHGQTNRLLGRITMRAYIFHHVLSGGDPLEGQALVDEVVSTATSLPGYREWCRHQHEIEHRAAEWARCIEGSHYFHFGYSRSDQSKCAQSIEAMADTTGEDSPGTNHVLHQWNQKRSQDTRDRIRQAIVDLLKRMRFLLMLQLGLKH